MGAKYSKEDLEIEESCVLFISSKRNCSDVNISLKRPLDIQLTPHFTTADGPGCSAKYKLQLRFKESLMDSSTGSTSDRLVKSLMADVELHEIVSRESKKITVGFERRKSVVKDNCWLGQATRFTKEADRLHLSGRLQKNTQNDSCMLDFELILCPGELIVPGCAQNWVLIGSFYVNNLKENKNYKWRAAVPREN